MLKGLRVLGDQVRPSSDKIEEDFGHLGYLREQGLEHGDVSGTFTPDLEALHGSCAFEPSQDLFKCSLLDAFDFRCAFLFDGNECLRLPPLGGGAWDLALDGARSLAAVNVRERFCHNAANSGEHEIEGLATKLNKLGNGKV
jgi:hypothetical protein